MENAQKAIMIGVGLFITIIIIAAVMLITGMGQNLLNQGTSQVSGISESLMNDLVQQYDGRSLTGSQVRTAAIQLLNRDAGITVAFNTSKITAHAKISKTIADDAEVKGIDSGSTDDYSSIINAALKGKDTVKFIGSVSRNSDTGVVIIKFK